MKEIVDKSIEVMNHLGGTSYVARLKAGEKPSKVLQDASNDTSIEMGQRLRLMRMAHLASVIELSIECRERIAMTNEVLKNECSKIQTGSNTRS